MLAKPVGADALHVEPQQQDGSGAEVVGQVDGLVAGVRALVNHRGVIGQPFAVGALDNVHPGRNVVAPGFVLGPQLTLKRGLGGIVMHLPPGAVAGVEVMGPGRYFVVVVDDNSG